MWTLIKKILFRFLARYFSKDDAAEQRDNANEQVLRDLQKGDSDSLTRSGGDDLDRLSKR